MARFIFIYRKGTKLTHREALQTAHELADLFQRWYEIHTNGADYEIIERGDQASEGYVFDTAISPRVRVDVSGKD